MLTGHGHTHTYNENNKKNYKRVNLIQPLREIYLNFLLPWHNACVKSIFSSNLAREIVFMLLLWRLVLEHLYN